LTPLISYTTVFDTILKNAVMQFLKFDY